MLQHLSNVSLRIRLLGAFGAVLVILVILTSAAYRTTVLNQEANNQVIHTFQVISSADALLTGLVDMETGYRGFLIGGEDVFLEPYRTGAAEFDTRVNALEALTADNAAQVARWQDIHTQVTVWQQQVTEPGIALRRAVGEGRAQQAELTAWVAGGEGRRRSEAIRAVFEQALAVEEQLLSQRQAEALDAGERLKIVLVVGTVLAVFLSVALALILTADIVGPVARMATTAREVAAGNLDERIGLRRRDEVGMAAAAFDQMTDRLQATILRSQAILNTAAEGILGLDHDGHVTFANAAAAQMLGVPAAGLIGRFAEPWFDITPPAPAAEREAAIGATSGDSSGAGGSSSTSPQTAAAAPSPLPLPLSPIAAVLRGAPVAEGAGELLRTGGHDRLPIEFACAAIQRDRDVSGAVLTFRDMTERRAAQRELEDHARELGRSNADLEQFAYVASHDLQEPLRAVVSYLQLLERRYGEQLDERAVRYIGHAVEGGRRMQTLITDLLTYSRVGRRGTEFEPIDLEAVFERVAASLRVAIEESGARLTHGLLPTVLGDDTQMSQVVQNLLGNAIKFREDAAPEIHVSAERQSGGWLISVRDNGIGIAPEYRDRVFVLFQRLHARDEYSGTGIGLAVCKKIVERHGGTLWVDSTLGGGSTFRFTLPDAGDQA